MNEQIIESLIKSVVATLPEEHRELYEYIVDLEDHLAQESQTSQEFLSLLVKHSPHKQAAMHFNLEYGETIKLMRDIEKEIDHQINRRWENRVWIDFTEKVRQQEGKENANRTLYFLSIL
ncbi:hypothetical protein LS684_01840 [Cytobacillus spongiae]|uniref:hypothetical protein n=1 Tax=Cytobacillus spongiae TaxID=2901381 RepID=UPI001F34DCBE|nr:hypothetical protein [Cytobacillus spongiae]UII56255.1 hypothetical protein LS684_01840 [Cytobacillus spongiae]